KPNPVILSKPNPMHVVAKCNHVGLLLKVKKKLQFIVLTWYVYFERGCMQTAHFLVYDEGVF
ncbi:hypothetical protein P3436_25570, partial [Vibrio parahaemolyticus]|nr:hypothetical protein [Vibrio parahaemolyticus]